MKKLFKNYAVIWAILFVAFNIIAFVSTGWVGIEKYTVSFWTGYVFITVAFLGQLACAWKAFNTDDIKKFFYNVPLITVSYAGLISTIVFGGLCMLLSLLWGWVALLVCAAVLAITVIAVVKAGTAAEIVDEIDKKVESKTAFIKKLRVSAEMLVERETDSETKKALESLAEKIRYSDPMSIPAVAGIEREISEKLYSLGESENRLADIAEITLLIEERNKMIKLQKQ